MQKSEMKNRNENRFIDKFHLLNSQATSVDISWSCSDSSEYEDVQCDTLNNITNKVNRKRKRVNNKKNDFRNISNLDITVVDTVPERKKSTPKKRSPILAAKTRSELLQKSPILTPSQRYLPHFMNNTTSNTPVTCYIHSEVSKEGEKSPIILLKRESPKASPRVKKKLFETKKCFSITNENSSKITSYTSHIISNNKDCLDRRKCTISRKKVIHSDINRINQIDSSTKHVQEGGNNYFNKESIPNLIDKWKVLSEHQNEGISILSTDSSSQDSAANERKTQTHLVSKVKSYFDSYFSSQGSQHSISECETPTPVNSSKNSDEIEIITPVTQVRQVTPSLKEIQTSTSLESDINTTKSKKVKYKKGGLAYRLNELLKRQNANISLWQHERFMAANSNFIIPKEEFLAFRIKHIDFKYGIYSLRVIDTDNERFLVIINSVCVNNIIFETDNVLKVYEPYTIIDSNSDYKIMFNICKFECGKLKF